MKISVNSKCPCGSDTKYKKCCQPYHKGAIAPTALALMKSRYSAYVLHNVDYIIQTTDINNPDFTPQTVQWKDDLLDFCKNTDFKKLDIIDFSEKMDISFVKFYVKLYINDIDQSFTENSKFIKKENKWLYLNATFE
jgi:SEC-C motif-containing protein